MQRETDKLNEFKSSSRKWRSWLWRIILAGLGYVLLFALVGLLVFQPAAKALEPVKGPSYIAEFQPDNPLGILGFQLVRGMLWALLTAPILLAMKTPRWQTGIIIGAAYAMIMAPLNLVPNGLVTGIRVAHALEVFVGNFMFGLFVVLLLCPQRENASSQMCQERRRLKASGDA
jgi:hypothetical protein